MLGWHSAGVSGVLTCSALKQSYRDILAKDLPPGSYKFVLLEAPVAVLAARMGQRPGHFMNPALLQSQLDTLEMPADALRVDATHAPETVAREILAALQAK
jgi:gluconokinase